MASTFGGSSRMLFDFAPDDGTDPGGAGAAAGDGDAGDAALTLDDAAAGADDGAAVEGADAGAGLPLDDPAFQEFLARRDEELLARVAQMNGERRPSEPAAPAGPPVNLDEFLSPLSDNFGTNLAAFLRDRDEYLLGKIGETLSPVLTREEEVVMQRGHDKMDELITRDWRNTDGKLTDRVKGAIKDLAPTYLPEMERIYGETPMAAEKALAKAASTIREINAGAREDGATSNADRLATLANANGEPGTASGAVDLPGRPRTPAELLERRFGLNRN